MMTKSILRGLILVCVLAALLLAAGCARKIVNNDSEATVSVSISAKAMSPGAASAVESFWLTVEGDDFGSSTVRMTQVGDFIIVEVEVLQGRDRRFVVRALDEYGTVLYEGETITDVVAGRVLVLEINLLPVVPMVNITPHYQQLEMGTSFSVDVNVFSILDLADVVFDIYFPTKENIITLDSVVKGSSLDATSYVNFEYGAYNPNAWVQAYQSNQLGTLVNAVGNAHLATLYFSGNSDTQFLVDTAQFQIVLAELWRVVGDLREPIPLKSVYIDAAMVRLIRNPFTPTWEKTIGGTGDDIGYSVCRAIDGGIVVAGTTGSFGAGLNDVYLAKVDLLGTMEWAYPYGGSNDDFGYCVVPTADGGYVICGSSTSYSPDGSEDVYLVKTDAFGIMEWEKTYGYDFDESGRSVVQAPDGGFMIAGASAQEGSSAIYALKTNSQGDSLWARVIGTGQIDEGRSIIRSPDDKYIIAGGTALTDFTSDVLLISIDDLGETVWQQTYGGEAGDAGNQVVATTDGGLITIGYSESKGAGLYEVYVIKTNGSGQLPWTKTYGFQGNDYGFGIAPTREGGYILAGCTSEVGSFLNKVYLVKTLSNGALNWYNKYGGDGDDVGYAVMRSSDGGYVIVGYTDSMGVGAKDIYIIKTDIDGNVAAPLFI